MSIFGKIKAVATAMVAVLLDGGATCDGGKQTIVSRVTPQEWCDYHGVLLVDGIATLYKAVGSDYMSPHGTSYAPGSTPVAIDWDGGLKECGGGLHFSPSPIMARAFNQKAERYIACPVSIADIVVHPNGSHPEKIKARGCCGPVWEVDEDGERVADEAATGPKKPDANRRKNKVRA